MRQTLDAIRYALRQLRAAPVFTARAATIALGIGGPAFTLIRGVMLASLRSPTQRRSSASATAPTAVEVPSR
jgi:hypothetical protein